MATVHVIGTGIGGLAAATRLAGAGIPVKLYEASTVAGGRCRSSHHSASGTIDHGLHVIAGHFRELFAYLDRIHARPHLQRISEPHQFTNLLARQHWKISKRRPLPAAPLADYLALGKLAIAPRGQTLGGIIGAENRLYDDWATPLARQVLHTPPEQASAETARGELWRRMRQPALYAAAQSLGETFITPALTYLDYHGGSVYFSHALKRIEHDGTRLSQLHFSRKKVPVSPEDVLILATPPQIAASLIPGIAVPKEAHKAITLHYRIPHRETPGSHHFLSNAPMDLVRYGESSIAVSIRIADMVWHSDQGFLAERIWRTLGELHPYLTEQSLPPWAMWRENYAGHALTPDDTARHTASQPMPRCFLAGDWVESGRPGNLESAALSGHRAAQAAIDLIGPYPERRQGH